MEAPTGQRTGAAPPTEGVEEVPSEEAVASEEREVEVVSVAVDTGAAVLSTGDPVATEIQGL